MRQLAVGVAVLVWLAAMTLPAGGLAASSAGGAPAWSAPVLVDQAQPTADGNAITGVSCPSVKLCVAVDSVGHVMSTTQPGRTAGPWRIIRLDTAQLSFVSCPSVRLCVAVGQSAGNGDGQLFVSRRPTSEPSDWQRIQLNYGVNGLACPSTRLCVITLAQGVLTSTNPAGGAQTWHRSDAQLPSFETFGKVTCPTTHFCASVSPNVHGDGAFVSTDPRDASTWHLRLLDPRTEDVLTGISCPSAQLCVATDDGDLVLRSRNPAVGAWSSRPIAPGVKVVSEGVWCRSASLCIAFAGEYTYVTNDLSAPWKPLRVKQYLTLAGVSCPSAQLCVGGAGAGRGSGDVVTSAHPLRGSWRTRPVDRYNAFLSISCPNASLCFAIDDSGHVLSSRDPGEGERAWHAVRIDPKSGLLGIACPTKRLCVAIGDRHSVFSSTAPTDAASAWTRTEVNPGQGVLTGLACPSARFCIAVGDGQARDVLTSTHPTGGTSAWRTSRVSSTLSTVACASAKLCLAGNIYGDVNTSTNPAGGTGSWHHVFTTPDGVEGGIISAACPTITLCVVASNRQHNEDYSGGQVYASADPTGPSSSWKLGTSWDAQDGLDIGPVECASTTLCFAANGNGAFISTNPTGGQGAWPASVLDPVAYITGLSCQRDTVRCVAVDANGEVLTSRATG
jgi:hypothetical protein